MKGSTENCKQFEGPEEVLDAKEKALMALEDVQVKSLADDPTFIMQWS